MSRLFEGALSKPLCRLERSWTESSPRNEATRDDAQRKSLNGRETASLVPTDVVSQVGMPRGPPPLPGQVEDTLR